MKPQQITEIVVMVRSDAGMTRLSLKSNNTLNDVVSQISKIVNVSEAGLDIKIEGNALNRYPPSTQLAKVPGFVDGAMLTVIANPKFKVVNTQMEVEKPKTVYTASGKPAKLNQTESHIHNTKEHALTHLCNHGPLAKCVNCLETKADDKPINKCTHGPGGKCLYCTPFDAKKDKIKDPTILCQHGPNGKCAHCVDVGQIDAKHLSFDQFLADAKFKCRDRHPEEGKCNNCLPPTLISYRVKRDCKNHAPYPQAMCNACLPPSIVLKRQVYRHVDYVEFLNIPEMSQLVQNWSSKQKSEQRAGFLFGYYAEDPNYKNGVRAIVEAIYEPPQRGNVGGVEILADPFEKDVALLAHSLGLEKIGWIFTTINHDCFLSSEELRTAAKFQQEYNIIHPSGSPVSKFLTVVLRTKKDNPDEVLPEVYMVSDQGQQLELDGIFQPSQRRKVLQVRAQVSDDDVLPNFIYEGKSVKEFEPDFFIVNVAHGYNPSSDYNILKIYDFPVENRSKVASIADVKTFLHRHQKKPSHMRFADFHFLLFLCKMIDVHSVARIAECVGKEQEVDHNLQDLVKLYVSQ